MAKGSPLLPPRLGITFTTNFPGIKRTTGNQAQGHGQAPAPQPPAARPGSNAPAHFADLNRPLPGLPHPPPSYASLTSHNLAAVSQAYEQRVGNRAQASVPGHAGTPRHRTVDEALDIQSGPLSTPLSTSLPPPTYSARPRPHGDANPNRNEGQAIQSGHAYNPAVAYMPNHNEPQPLVNVPPRTNPMDGFGSSYYPSSWNNPGPSAS